MLPPTTARFESSTGYDGQYFWLMALSPALGDASVRGLHAVEQEYRAQRIVYPTAAAVLALGRSELIPWALLLINLAVLIAATLLGARWAARSGRSPYWGLVIGFTPGLVLGMLRDLSDPLAVTAVAGGLIAWRLDRRGAAAVLLAVAVLTRETMALGVLAVAVDVLLRARREQQGPARALRRGWPVILVPALAFLAWQAYAATRLGQPPLLSTGANVDVPGIQGQGQFGAPLQGVVTNLERASADPDPRSLLWDWAYLLLLVGAALLAALRAVRGPDLLRVSAAVFGIVVLFQIYGDRWSFTRASAPLFVCLALSGLERNDRVALGFALAAAALVLLVPGA